MFKVASIALCCATASAFVAPSSKALARSASHAASLKMVVDDMLGSDIETGGVWDPLGYSKNEDELYRYRQVELKHGRVAMLATLGVFFQYYFQLPDPVFSQGAKPIQAALQVWQERPLAVWQILIAASLVELTIGKQDPTKAPGDLGTFGDFAKSTDGDDFAAVQLKELKNGRLAMVAFTAMQVQEALTGQGPLEQLATGHVNPFGDGEGFF